MSGPQVPALRSQHAFLAFILYSNRRHLIIILKRTVYDSPKCGSCIECGSSVSCDRSDAGKCLLLAQRPGVGALRAARPPGTPSSLGGTLGLGALEADAHLGGTGAVRARWLDAFSALICSVMISDPVASSQSPVPGSRASAGGLSRLGCRC